MEMKYDGKVVQKLEGFFEEIDMDGCTWQMAGNSGGVIITLEKAEGGVSWPRLFK